MLFAFEIVLCYLQSTVVQLLMMLQILCCLLSDKTRQTRKNQTVSIRSMCMDTVYLESMIWMDGQLVNANS